MPRARSQVPPRRAGVRVYGARPSSELLISYGFAPQVGENPDDEYELTIGVDPEDRHADAKAAALRALGLRSCGVLPSAPERLPQAAPAVREFILCDPEDPEELPELAERALVGQRGGGRRPRRADQGEEGHTGRGARRRRGRDRGA